MPPERRGAGPVRPRRTGFDGPRRPADGPPPGPPWGPPGFVPRPRFPADRPRRPDDRPHEFRPRPPADRPWQERPPRPFTPRPYGAGHDADAAPPAAPHAAAAPDLEEGEELIAGRRPVEEAFTAGRPPRRLLVTPQRRHALEKIVLHATTLRIPIVEVEGGSLTALAGFDGHQGVAVVVEARRFASVDDILARSIERKEPPFVLVLDSLEDPQNVGTLLRSAEAAGVHGVVFPTERQAPLSPAAIKASAGATEHLLLAPVDDLAGALTDLHLRGLRIVGSEADAPLTAREADLRGPLALVIGSEGHGLSPAIRRRCDLFIRIPMRGVIGSLNAAVAGSILLFEALGQHDPIAARPEPAAPATPARKPRARKAPIGPTAEPDAAPGADPGGDPGDALA
jgi:23S rRNA (guanosine2251-2'-O)-methyltransferase